MAESVNKAELVDRLAVKLNITKKDAGAALEAIVAEITSSVAKGDKVAISGFGVFEKADRAARVGRNPQTGATVKIKATSVPKFRAGADFKNAVAGRRAGGSVGGDAWWGRGRGRWEGEGWARPARLRPKGRARGPLTCRQPPAMRPPPPPRLWVIVMGKTSGCPLMVGDAASGAGGGAITAVHARAAPTAQPPPNHPALARRGAGSRWTSARAWST